ncbi:hypothetical protein [Pseudomonas purpurea]|uniref:hypothetical protein n=1 Tax=Pseudomonas purpurea TaxID=3136737 RepID=UPI003264C451
MKIFRVSLFAAALHVTGACAESDFVRVDAKLPDSMGAAITQGSEMLPAQIHWVPGGALSWSGGYIATVVFEASSPNCAIFTYSNNALSTVFAGVPCMFKGPPTLKFGRNIKVPDIVYAVQLSNQGVMVDEGVALYFDAEKNTFCESRNLSDWYRFGNKKRLPSVDDGHCSGFY